MMTEKKYMFLGLVLIILCIFIFLGYVYYSSTRPLKEIISLHNPIADNQVTKTQKMPSDYDVAITPTLTRTTSSTIKQDYQPTETEKLFYRTIIESLRPKPTQRKVGGKTICDDGIIWNRDTYKTFPPRKPYPAQSINLLQKVINNPAEEIKELQETIKQYNDSVSYSRQYYQEIIMNLQELIKQCSDSPYYPHYQEFMKLILQMQKEDEEFYDKYDINKLSISRSYDVHYRGTVSLQSALPIDEKIPGYIYCLRYSYFYNLNKRYAMEFGGSMSTILPRYEPLLSGAKFVQIGNPAVPSLLNILEDRRPIIAVDDTKMPAVFYRYQDAAVEILQRMFVKAKTPFPLQLPEDEYFSEYLSRQTPENKQKIISDIKAWVEESMKNPATPQQPPESPK